MNDTANGGPAFPRPISVSSIGDTSWDQDGMSLRDYFAGQAMVGIVGNFEEAADAAAKADAVAEDAYILADAMLKARNAP